MASLLSLIETGLMTALAGNASLNTAVSGQIYDMQAESGATGDYCVFHWVGGGDDNFNARRSADVLYAVEGYSPIHANAELLAGYIDVALINQQLSIAGWTTYGLTLGRLISLTDNINGIPYYRKGGVYRIRIDNA